MTRFNIIIYIAIVSLLFSTTESRIICNGNKARKNAEKRNKEIEEKYAPKILEWKENVDKICALVSCSKRELYYIVDLLEKQQGNNTYVLEYLEKENRSKAHVNTIYLSIFIILCSMILIGNL